MIKKLFIAHRSIAQAVLIRRTFCEASKKCWNCSVTLGSSHQIFCSKCETIQNVPKVVSMNFIAQFSRYLINYVLIQDYFELFELRKHDAIDATVLTTKFRKYQSFIHPDKFSGKSVREQELSSEWSSLINKAYKILQSPLERGEYLLRLHGVILPEDNTINDPEFLSEMMERNEEVLSDNPTNILLY